MQAILPIEVYEAFEKGLGKVDAKIVVKSIETTISYNIENKWSSSKDNLLGEMKKEFASKADLQLVRAEIQQLKTELSAQMKLYFLILLFVIILTNPSALEIISKVLGITK